MLSKLRARLSYANVIATLALFVALGGSSYAAIKVTGKNVRDSSLSGRDIKNSTLTSSDVKNRSLLAADFRAGQLPAGPQGPQGAQGPQGIPGVKGDAGAPATKLWARVSGAGALVAGSGATGVARTEAGRYNVSFNQNVSGCAWVSSSDFRGIGDGWGVHVDHGTPPSPNQVRVLTSLDTSATVDQPFDVAVFC